MATATTITVSPHAETISVKGSATSDPDGSQGNQPLRSMIEIGSLDTSRMKREEQQHPRRPFVRQKCDHRYGPKHDQNPTTGAPCSDHQSANAPVRSAITAISSLDLASLLEKGDYILSLTAPRV